MNEDLKRFEFKVDRIDQRLNNIDITLAKQSVILDEHVKRSTMLEAQVKPIQKHVNMVSGIIKFIGLIGTLAAIAESFLMFKK